MKVIDLLNKIANKEEIPKKIMFEGKWYKWNILMNDYEYEEKHLFLVEGLEVEDLNELVFETEIEDKKIYKLDWVEGNTFNKIQENSYLSRKEIQLLDSNFKELGNKINEIIDYINKGDKE